MNIRLREACEPDIAFARTVYFETMRWIIVRLFGWDEVREHENFNQFLKLDEVSIITADGQDVGWIQQQVEHTTINLGSFYLKAAMQRQGWEGRSFSPCLQMQEIMQRRLPWS